MTSKKLIGEVVANAQGMPLSDPAGLDLLRSMLAWNPEERYLSRPQCWFRPARRVNIRTKREDCIHDFHGKERIAAEILG